MPMRSTSSPVSRSPAVSTTTSGTPSTCSACTMRSRVVPGTGVTIATSAPASAFSRLDFPTFGAPASTTCKPSRNSAPCLASASSTSSSERTRASRPRASERSRKSISSSGKSSVASISMRSSVS